MKKEYISFDIFDTLVGRKVSIASDIFSIVGEKILDENDAKDFRELRIKAEKIARSHSSNNETNLQSIYEYMERFDESTKQKLMKEEIYQEYINCYGITDSVDFLNEMLKHGKKCILISDMYLSKSDISNILQKCEVTGICSNDIFVSNECGCNKVNGALFEYVLDCLNISSKSIIHIGDSINADILGARKAAVKGLVVFRKHCIKRKIKSALVRFGMSIL